MFQFEIIGEGTGSYQIRDSQTGEPVRMDGVALVELTLESAGAYLYALSILNGVAAAGSKPHIIKGIATALDHCGPVANLEDVLGSVVQNTPSDLPRLDVLRILIRKVAGERGTILR